VLPYRPAEFFMREPLPLRAVLAPERNHGLLARTRQHHTKNPPDNPATHARHHLRQKWDAPARMPGSSAV
jgi:hypothetical protein